jgi:serine phosphatase RsbU (regulator of sigma subunit)
VDRIQYETGQGPCLSAIREEGIFHTDDLREEKRWPAFSARAAAETGVRSMLSFRLFLREDTLGSLNLYSRNAGAFTEPSRSIGAVFASHAAVAFAAAREHDRAEGLVHDLHDSRLETHRYSRQAQIAVALQRGMLTDLPDAAPAVLAARYLPSMTAAEIGGDWYDAFTLPDGDTALVIGDIAGHDLDAAITMGQVRNTLRALAMDRIEAPGQLLQRLDRVLDQLGSASTATCIYARIHTPGSRDDQTGGTGGAEGTDSSWQIHLANAGHPPPLLIPAMGAPRFLHGLPEPMLGADSGQPRHTLTFALPPGSTLLLYTDGLIERRDRDLDLSLEQLRTAATDLGQRTPHELCDLLLTRLAAHPTDDVCLLAIRTPPPPTG